MSKILVIAVLSFLFSCSPSSTKFRGLSDSLNDDPSVVDKKEPNFDNSALVFRGPNYSQTARENINISLGEVKLVRNEGSESLYIDVYFGEFSRQTADCTISLNPRKDRLIRLQNITATVGVKQKLQEMAYNWQKGSVDFVPAPGVLVQKRALGDVTLMHLSDDEVTLNIENVVADDFYLNGHVTLKICK